jgi:hypothetical protein
MIPINLPNIGEEEIEAVVKVMRSGLLTSGLGAGPKVKEFEHNYAEFTGVKHAITVTQVPQHYTPQLCQAELKRAMKLFCQASLLWLQLKQWY